MMPEHIKKIVDAHTLGAGTLVPQEDATNKNWTEVQAPNKCKFLNLPHIDMIGYYQLF